jgi:putative ABC transport system ATP-binding protein
MDCILEARALAKTYGEGAARVEALRGIDLVVQGGQFLAIMGPSGSGKSTLLHLLAGVEQPTTGQVLLEGRDLAQLDDDERTLIRRRRMGFVFQHFNLLPTLTAMENVTLPLLLDGVSPSDARQRGAAALAMVNMEHRQTHLPSELSGGEQQRVAVARALVIEPALLLADEPTGNLDSDTGQQVVDLLRRLVRERRQTIVIVTHDAQVAAQADSTVHVRDGRLESHQVAPTRRVLP